MNNTETLFITVPLEKEAHLWARGFAAEQATPDKGKRVYLNTLAVYAVQSFLKWLQIETDLEDADSWHPIARSLFNVADLVIPNLGKLECRPVLIGENVLTLPPEVMEDRIGYIAVGFQEQLNEVQLLGFAPALEPGNVLTQLPITNLQPLENLIDYLYRLELANEYLQSNDEVAIQMRERLTEQYLSEIVAQLERIYRTCDKDEWRFIGGNLLAGTITTGGVYEKNTASVVDREGLDEEQQIDFQDLAEELLDKLGEIWESSDALAAQDVISIESFADTALQTQQPSVSIYEKIINLSECLRGNFDSAITAGLEIIQGLLEVPAYQGGFRSGDATEFKSHQSTIAKLIEQINNKEDEFVCLEAAKNLLEIDPKNLTALNAIVELIQTTQVGDIRWNSVEVLARFKPEYIPKGLGFIKQFELGNPPNLYFLKLGMALMDISEQDISLFFRLYSVNNEDTLPKGIKLIELDEHGEILEEVPEVDEEYRIIQYKIIYSRGEKFSIKIKLEKSSFIENFLV